MATYTRNYRHSGTTMMTFTGQMKSTDRSQTDNEGPSGLLTSGREDELKVALLNKIWANILNLALEASSFSNKAKVGTRLDLENL